MNDGTGIKLAVGQRVELHPATGYWMQGARFGEVVKIGRLNIRVKLDKYHKDIAIRPYNVNVVQA